jgi:hypothetical protein
MTERSSPVAFFLWGVIWCIYSYLDESGNETGAEDRYFVLAGAAIFERQTFFLGQSLDRIQTERLPGLPPEPFHSAAIRSGKHFWRKVSEETRKAVLADLAKALAQAAPTLFAAVVEKSNQIFGEKAVERAIEETCKRFDTFLMRCYQEKNNPQRGLLIFAEGRFHQRARLLVSGFRELGTRWGGLKNLCDIPYFASMSDTRLLQVADFVAHATWLLYEKRDPSLIRQILQLFDSKDGVIHGLVHLRSDPKAPCACPACASRRNPGTTGDWL